MSVTHLHFLLEYMSMIQDPIPAATHIKVFLFLDFKTLPKNVLHGLHVAAAEAP